MGNLAGNITNCSRVTALRARNAVGGWALICLLVLAGSATIGAAAPKPAKLTVLAHSASMQHVWIEEAGKVYTSLHPYVTIEVVTGTTNQLLAMMAGGIAPDIVYQNNSTIPSYASKGFLVDLAPLAKRDASINLGGFLPNSLDLLTYGGKLYGLPRTWGAVGLMYNATRFDERGVAYPNESWTWNDLLNNGRKLTWDASGDGVTDHYAFDDQWTAANRWPMWVMQAGGRVWNDDYTEVYLDSPEAIAGLEFQHSLYWTHRIAPALVNNRFAIGDPPNATGEAGLRELFETGRTAMQWQTRYYVPPHDDYVIDIAPVPQGPSGRQNIMVSAYAGITRETKVLNEAWEFVKFLTTSREGWFVADLPHKYTPAEIKLAREELSRPSLMNEMVWLTVVQGSRPSPASSHPHSINLQGMVAKAINGAASGAAPLEAGLAEAARQIRAYLAEVSPSKE